MRALLTGVAVVALIIMCPRYEARPGPMAMISSISNPAPVAVPRAEVGVASWYGEEVAWNQTASGELFDGEGFTAAHRYLPLGTRIRVTNLRNMRSVVLRVNDRGPGVRGRVLDVSRAAAEQLGFDYTGAALVRIKVLRYPRGYVARGIKAASLTYCRRRAG